VAQDASGLRKAVLAGVEVGAADAAGADPDEKLVLVRVGCRHLLDRELRIRPAIDGGLHLRSLQ
jgi:hypothetical protein